MDHEDWRNTSPGKGICVVGKKMKKILPETEIFFFPRLPDIRHSIWRILDILSLTATSMQRGGSIGFFGEGNTYCLPAIDIRNRKIINAECVDISKSHVDSCFKEVFGYSITIDPYTYKGLGVKKSELNYKHDGEIIPFPIKSKQEGYVYNKLISNLIDDNIILDMRVPIIGSKIPLVFLRYRSISKRFSDYDICVKVAETKKMLSDLEIEKILKFCKMMKLEFGELDVLRNKDEKGLLYIVDVSRTPASPPKKLPKFIGHHCMKIMADCFAKEFLKGPIENIHARYKYYKILYQFKRPYIWLKVALLALYRMYIKPIMIMLIKKS